MCSCRNGPTTATAKRLSRLFSCGELVSQLLCGVFDEEQLLGGVVHEEQLRVRGEGPEIGRDHRLSIITRLKAQQDISAMHKNRRI